MIDTNTNTPTSLDAAVAEIRKLQEQRDAADKQANDARDQILKTIAEQTGIPMPSPVINPSPTPTPVPTKPVVIPSPSHALNAATLVAIVMTVIAISVNSFVIAHVSMRVSRMETAIGNIVNPSPSPVPTPVPTPVPSPVPTPGGSIDPDIRVKAAAYFGGYISRYGADPSKVDAGSTWNEIEASHQAEKKKQGKDLGLSIDAIIKPDVDETTQAFKEKAKGKADLTKIRDSLRAGLIDAINSSK